MMVILQKKFHRLCKLLNLAHIGTEVSKAAVEQTPLRLLRFWCFFSRTIDTI